MSRSSISTRPPAKRLPTSSAISKHKPLFLPCDLTDIDALQKAIADVKAALGPIEVLVNNAANDKRHTDRRSDAASLTTRVSR